jgi:hypothetical protein
MLYRIICSTIAIPGRIPGRLLGAFMAGVDGFNLKYPGIANPPARFYLQKRVGVRSVVLLLLMHVGSVVWCE